MLTRINLIRKAIEFATIKHAGQVRKGSGLDYVIHPIRVGFILSELRAPLAVIIAGFLHDVLEDTKTTYDELVAAFGKEIADIVLALTSNKAKIKIMGKNEYLIHKMSFILTDNELLGKLGDRLDNISDEPADKYILDTIVMMKELQENRPNMTVECNEAIMRINIVLNEKVAIINEKAGNENR